MNGYLHPNYAISLAEFGTPLELPQCKGWILKRKIPNSPYYDAMGCYPLFACQDWSKLHNDLENIGDDLVSLSLVTDPFGNYNEAYLNQCFKDIVIPFKEHFIVDFRCRTNQIGRKRQRRYARQALKEIQIDVCQKPIQYLEEWVTLYNKLIEKHDILGIPAFSTKAFATQLDIPGMIMFRAIYQGITIGAITWLVQGKVGYCHLIALSEVGYKLRASYALYWFAITYFSNKLRWLNFGASAGIANNNQDGLSQFKRGWSTGTRTAYFCGRIFDRKKYTEILQTKGSSNVNYFPAYRAGEFR